MLRRWLCWGMYPRPSGYWIKHSKPMGLKVKLPNNINTLFKSMGHLLKTSKSRNLSKRKNSNLLKSLQVNSNTNPFTRNPMEKRTHQNLFKIEMRVYSHQKLQLILKSSKKKFKKLTFNNHLWKDQLLFRTIMNLNHTPKEKESISTKIIHCSQIK